MALIDDLVGRVGGERLRSDLAAAVAQLRDGLKFGLVFEEHEPEVMPTPEVPVRAGSLAVDRSGSVVSVISISGEGPDAVATVRREREREREREEL